MRLRLVGRKCVKNTPFGNVLHPKTFKQLLAGEENKNGFIVYYHTTQNSFVKLLYIGILYKFKKVKVTGFFYPL